MPLNKSSSKQTLHSKNENYKKYHRSNCITIRFPTNTIAIIEQFKLQHTFLEHTFLTAGQPFNNHVIFNYQCVTIE
jgi:hypothetical protein